VVTDDLNTPLGLAPKPARFRVSRLALVLAVLILGAGLATFIVWGVIGHEPLGGEPMAVVNAGLAATRGTEKQPNSPSETGGSRQVTESSTEPGLNASLQEPDRSRVGRDKTAARPEQVITIIDGKSGARQEVRIPGDGDNGANIAADASVGISPNGKPSGDPEAQLVEMTRNGPIPRIAPDGQRAAQFYARPTSAKPNSPQIAIVFTGLGVSSKGTTEALNKLPGPITFAFSPYGVDLERSAAKARSLGHELLLQVPMEPLDYPDNDSGPQTLLASLTPDQNIDRLQWAMSRFSGYVGIVNLMGARFTASELALLPVLREIGRRGLIYVDDGSSPLSLASQIAAGNNLAFAKAGLVLDVAPSPSEIDRALARLEGLARDNGIAVGFATALPVSLDRISRWAKSAGSRGYSLAPITAAVGREKSS
jgi:polysaccharide deacetylase 2 family uncharacterized protein YibQ